MDTEISYNMKKKHNSKPRRMNFLKKPILKRPSL